MDPLEKRAKNVKKKKKKKKKREGKKKKVKKNKGNLIYEFSLGEIRLMTSPCIRSRLALSKIVLDRERKTYKLR